MRRLILPVAFGAVAIVTSLNIDCIAQAQTTSTSTNATYIGLRHGPKLPPGLKEEGGGLISDPYKDKTQFGIAHVTRGKQNFLWFELGTHHNAAGQAFWEVLDVVTLPPLRRNHIVMYTLCLLNDKPDPEIAAVIEPIKPGSYDTRTLRAWRANRQTRKFEEITVKGVKCEMQGDD
jgi:hypothetical protein